VLVFFNHPNILFSGIRLPCPSALRIASLKEGERKEKQDLHCAGYNYIYTPSNNPLVTNVRSPWLLIEACSALSFYLMVFLWGVALAAWRYSADNSSRAQIQILLLIIVFTRHHMFYTLNQQNTGSLETFCQIGDMSRNHALHHSSSSVADPH
jgi:dipeptide/tripeptide permease